MLVCVVSPDHKNMLCNQDQQQAAQEKVISVNGNMSSPPPTGAENDVATLAAEAKKSS